MNQGLRPRQVREPVARTPAYITALTATHVRLDPDLAKALIAAGVLEDVEERLPESSRVQRPLAMARAAASVSRRG
jgi:hypothetical protein